MTKHAESEVARTSQTTLGQDMGALARHWLSGRRGMLIVGGGLALGGVGFGWSWLVAAGIAPIILGVLPCVAMCALGLCMKGGKASTSARPDAAEADEGSQIPGKGDALPHKGSPAAQPTVSRRLVQEPDDK